MLVVDKDERSAYAELRPQFEAVYRLDRDEKKVVKSVREAAFEDRSVVPLACLLANPPPCLGCCGLALTDRHQTSSNAAAVWRTKEHRKLSRFGLGQRRNRCQKIDRLARLILRRQGGPRNPHDEVRPTLGYATERTAMSVARIGDHHACRSNGKPVQRLVAFASVNSASTTRFDARSTLRCRR